MKEFTLVALFFSFFLVTSQAQTTYQAEDGFEFDGAIENEHTGFTGSGYVNLENTETSYLSMKVSMANAGEQTLTIFFANGASDNRPMDVVVNGNVAVSDLAFNSTGEWTSYQTQETTVSLEEGLNTITFNSKTADGGPNVDKIELTGEVGPEFHTVEWSVFGDGTVSGLDSKELLPDGEKVTLTATPSGGAAFGGWKGSMEATEKELSFTVTEDVSVSAVFFGDDAYANTTEQLGWATYRDNGHQAVTGGENGTEVTVSSQSELEQYLNHSDPYIMNIEGTIEITPMGKKMDVSSDKTIRGVGTDAVIKGGGFRIKNAENVIVQYLTMKDAYVDWEGKTTDNDAIEINNSKHVWINHCDFSHFDDGLIDIKNASDFVTVSWCHFHNHNKVMLIGAGDDATQNIGKLNVTIHHCWFDGSDGNGIGQRLPMGRFGKIHVFNNYYNDVITRGVEANFDANMVVDNNYYLNTIMPHVLVGGAGDNKMNASGNIYVDTGSRRDANRQAFNPADYYEVTYNNAEDVPALVMLGAGVNNVSEIGSKATFDNVAKVETETVKLSANYPNPVVDESNITFTLPVGKDVLLELYDMTGKKVKNLTSGFYGAGKHTVTIDGSALKSGLYIYTLKVGDTFLSKSLIVK